jgi:hypothetical protein
MPTLTTVLDLAVLDGHAAERHHQFGVLSDLGERWQLIESVVEGVSEDVRDDHMAGSDRVVVDRIGIARSVRNRWIWPRA